MVVEENSTVYYRYDKKKKTNIIKFEDNNGNKKGWTLLDSFSASSFLKVWNQANDENKDKLDSMDVEKAISIAFKIIGKYGR